jgi:hypothetical protein
MLQYHSRSDHHSKVACWAIAFDLLATSALLRSHARAGKITIGVNHEMIDFKLGRKKNLDLVIARPANNAAVPNPTSLADFGARWGVILSDQEEREFGALPGITRLPVSVVLVALEAKACMTEHGKSEPRLFDELNSSQQTVHGAADQAVAAGLAMINIAERFVSPGRQLEGREQRVTHHTQPAVTASAIAKVRELPRRTAPGTDGFDALGIIVIDLKNDGSPVTIYDGVPAPQVGELDTYEAMVMRTANLYDFRFSSI